MNLIMSRVGTIMTKINYSMHSPKSFTLAGLDK